MENFRKIQLSDKFNINRIRLLDENILSAMTFPNLFCWQDIINSKICFQENSFIVKYDENHYQLCGDIKECVFFLNNLIKKNQDFIVTHITEYLKKTLTIELPKIKLFEDRNNFDYIADINGLADLNGGIYKTIRKEIHNYSNNKLSFEYINDDNILNVVELVKTWNNIHSSNYNTLIADTQAELIALKYYNDLDFNGIIIKNDNNYVSMIISSEINDSITDIHFSKCIDTGKGADYFCKHIFCKIFKSYYKYINMEEDMGIIGLRMRKTLLRPSYMNKVYLGIYQKDFT